MIVFDGKKFAKRNLESLPKDKGKTLVSILVGNDKASEIYTKLKQKAAKSVGCKMEVRRFNENVDVTSIIRIIEVLNKDESVDGIMVQLPLPGKIQNLKHKIQNSINREKDVDGMREDSDFVPATVKAVISIIQESLQFDGQARINKSKDKIVVVGGEGSVGKALIANLRMYELTNVRGVDIETQNLKSKIQNADVVISATGVPNLIKGDMVKDGVVVIDVGAPKGDVEFESVSKKAKFITPVPGGVGPVTVACLMENLVVGADSP